MLAEMGKTADPGEKMQNVLKLLAKEIKYVFDTTNSLSVEVTQSLSKKIAKFHEKSGGGNQKNVSSGFLAVEHVWGSEKSPSRGEGGDTNIDKSCLCLRQDCFSWRRPQFSDGAEITDGYQFAGRRGGAAT